ncbi:hypothetical protein [Paraburkholderia sp. 31.1]|uniref:hypothetical protein n=1 Tax=Paraburkholderia sp. 31.1 TaxID=2615205 RepID=UPI0016552212|nr:hypothetical protein [Paraburkholderia sp. 31.1]
MPSPTSLARSNFCYGYGCYPYQPSNEAFLPENRKEGACRYQAGSAYFSVHVSVRLAPPVNANGLVVQEKYTRYQMRVPIRRGHQFARSPPIG